MYFDDLILRIGERSVQTTSFGSMSKAAQCSNPDYESLTKQRVKYLLNSITTDYLDNNLVQGKLMDTRLN